MSNEYKFPWRDDIGEDFTADSKKIKNLGDPVEDNDAENKQHNHPLEDLEVINDPDDGDVLTWIEESGASGGGYLEWKQEDISIEEDDIEKVSEAKIINFEGNVEVIEESGGKATINIGSGSTFNLAIQEDDIEIAENVDTINFEFPLKVTDDGSGKVTISLGANPKNYSTGQSSTTSTNWQQKLRLTFTPDIAGDYEIHWSALVSHMDTGVFMKMRIQIDDSVTYNEWAQEFYNFKYEDGAWSIKSGVFVVNLSQVSHNIDMDFRSGESGKTMYIKEALLIARRIT